jgi:hypothetical protein
MAKRLSAIFSLSKDDHGTDHSQHSRNPSDSMYNASLAPPRAGRLHKSTSPTTPSQAEPTFPEPTLPITPLAPPPLLTGDGMFRPPSSAGSGSRPPSQASVRSRPQTPSFAITPTESNSPVLPTTPGSAGKLSKKSSWLPGKSSRNKNGEQPLSRAWIAGLPDHIPYDLTPLLAGDRVSGLFRLVHARR